MTLQIVQFCSFAPPWNGQNRSDELSAQVLSRFGSLERVDISAGTLRRSPAVRFRRSVRVVRSLLALRSRLRQRKADVFYIVPASSFAGFARDAACIRSVRAHTERVVARVHCGDFHRCFERGATRTLARHMVDDVDQFVFLSEGLASRCQSFIPASKCRVVPNWIDEELRMDDVEAAAKIDIGAPDRELRVAFVSNMYPEKGVIDVVEAVAECRYRRGLAVSVDFVGGFRRERDRRSLERLLRQFDLGDAVCIHGSVDDRQTIRRILAAAHALLLPSYHRVEAQPRAILEALNAATPVVATRHGGIPEMIENDGNGYLVDARAPLQIADALEKLSDPSNWAAKAAAARASYCTGYPPEQLERRLAACVLGRPELADA